MKNQKEYTEEILFNNYMVSSLGEECVHCQIPFYFEKCDYDRIIGDAEAVNEIALKVLDRINGEHKRLLDYFEDFKLKERIFNLKCSMSPMFWTRYDTFIDEDDNIYFSEFNYDKPCGQKEMALAGKLDFQGNINKDFIENFKTEFEKICGSCNSDVLVNVAFLMDPCHYEELHHSYYFKDILKDRNINIIQAGPNNLSVKNDYVYVYNEIKVDIILRLFPTEFFYEIINIEEILDCFDKGNVLIINDPRIIAIQAKGFFAYLWDLIKENSNLISENDKEVIKRCIPYTEIIDFSRLKPGQYEELINNKDKYVVKSSLGRYSMEVYIGKLYNDETWKEQINVLKCTNKLYIRQDLINIRKEYTYRSDGCSMNIPEEAYGNFGVYIMKKKAEGMLVRWSRTLLTDDNYTWMSPLGYSETPMRIEKCRLDNREDILEEICEEAAFKYNFTGSFTNIYEYISLDILVLQEKLKSEIYYAGEMLCNILKKTYPVVKENLDMFGKILGIPEELYTMIENSSLDELCAIGRIDFALDNENNLKILEFNTETPAGIVEAVGINEIVKEKLKLNYENPNENLRSSIRENIRKILSELENKTKSKLDNELEDKSENKVHNKLDSEPENKTEDKIENEFENKPESEAEDKTWNTIENEFEKKTESKLENRFESKLNNKINNKPEKIFENKTENKLENKKHVKNIAVVTTWYYEDIYTAGIIGEIIKEIDGVDVIFGNVHDLKIKEGKLYLYNNEIDAVYRHYPLDWFYYEKDMNPFIKLLECGDYLINSAETLIIQSKAFLAVIYELNGRGFFTSEEEDFIKKYIPYTCLQPNKNLSHDYLVKPLLSREGDGIKASYQGIESNVKEYDMIFQDRVNTKPFYSDIYSSMGKEKAQQFPILGLYMCGQTPCGLYVRRSSFVTDKNAVLLPVFVE